MRVSWISYLDPFVYKGGGELSQRALIEHGRSRGHEIVMASFLKRRPQRALRRWGIHTQLAVDLNSDAFVLTNLMNAPSFPTRIPAPLLDQVLGTGRAAVFEEAWVDICPFDLPCLGVESACRTTCDRNFADSLYSRARVAIFNSPRQRDAIAAVIGVPLPQHQILSRPAIDVERFRDLGLQRDIDVLYVGRVSRDKGYYNLIERFGAERLTLAGPNVLGGPIEGNYLGPVDYADIPILMNRARIFAHLPEWIEPMGRTPAEAALCGCDVVMNDRVGVASYPREDWTDRETIRRAPERFWEDFEAAYA